MLRIDDDDEEDEGNLAGLCAEEVSPLSQISPHFYTFSFQPFFLQMSTLILGF